MNEIHSEDVILVCWVLQAIFSGVAVLIAGLSLPMYFEKIFPNRWYGVRTRKTLENEVLWYRVNKSCAKNMLWACLVIFVLNLLLLCRFCFFPEHVAWVWIIVGSQLVVSNVGLLIAVGLALLQTNE
ncbi:MAG: hypothetical protein B6I25_03925 [Planctomycetales bacterium 4572_13]|nr:MAG: hypothetical protein B6I25_03925 [Planctomycetales bacterium 4572_13]